MINGHYNTVDTEHRPYVIHIEHSKSGLRIEQRTKSVRPLYRHKPHTPPAQRNARMSRSLGCARRGPGRHSLHLLWHVLWWRRHHRRRHHSRHSLWHVSRWRWRGSEARLWVEDRDARRRGRNHAHGHTLHWWHPLHRWWHRRHSLWDPLGNDCLLRGKASGRGRCGSECAGELSLVRALEARHRRARPEGPHRCWRRTRSDRERIVLSCLRSKQTFCRGTVTFAFAVLLEGVLDGNGLVHEELAIHGFNSRVR